MTPLPHHALSQLLKTTNTGRLVRHVLPGSSRLVVWEPSATGVAGFVMPEVLPDPALGLPTLQHLEDVTVWGDGLDAAGQPMVRRVRGDVRVCAFLCAYVRMFLGGSVRASLACMWLCVWALPSPFVCFAVRARALVFRVFPRRRPACCCTPVWTRCQLWISRGRFGRAGPLVVVPSLVPARVPWVRVVFARLARA
jgi:hypothetical protein